MSACRTRSSRRSAGCNRIDIRTDGSFEVAPLVVRPERLDGLQKHLLLRLHRSVAPRLRDRRRAGLDRSADKTAELKAMRELVDEARGDPGRHRRCASSAGCCDESWKLKRSLSSKIAPAFVNEIYDAARKAGADGGKLLGAGGGGFMLIFVEPARRKAVVDVAQRAAAGAVPVRALRHPDRAVRSREPQRRALTRLARRRPTRRGRARAVSRRWSPRPQFSSCDGR